jgi:hypothetical protein
VRRDLLGALRLVTVPTLALAFVAAFVPGRLELAVRVYALLLVLIVVGYALKALRDAYPPASRLSAAVSATEGDRARPASLAQIEHECALGVASSFDVHHRLRPRLRDLASGLLTARRHISLDRDPAGAREALGEPAWDLVRRDRPPPEDRLARGLPVADLRVVVESLERV